MLAAALVWWQTRSQNWRWQREFEQKFPLASSLPRRGKGDTPGTAAAEYLSEYESLLAEWRRLAQGGSMDRAAKHQLFRKRVESLREGADSYCLSPFLYHRYRAAYRYALSGAAASLVGEFALAGELYHYGAMIFRMLTEWDRAGGFYCVAGLLVELVSTKPELVKARHSFTRAIAAYRAGGNPEGEAYARQAFDRVTKHLKEEHKYVWGSEEVEAFQQLLTMRE